MFTSMARHSRYFNQATLNYRITCRRQNAFQSLLAQGPFLCRGPSKCQSAKIAFFLLLVLNTRAYVRPRYANALCPWLNADWLFDGFLIPSRFVQAAPESTDWGRLCFFIVPLLIMSPVVCASTRIRRSSLESSVLFLNYIFTSELSGSDKINWQICWICPLSFAPVLTYEEVKYKEFCNCTKYCLN